MGFLWVTRNVLDCLMIALNSHKLCYRELVLVLTVDFGE